MTLPARRTDSARCQFTCQHKPASFDFETIDANQYAEWEVDYLKLGDSAQPDLFSRTYLPPAVFECGAVPCSPTLTNMRDSACSHR